MSCISPFPLNTICISTKHGAKFPYRETKYAASYDLFTPTTVELPPGKITAVDLELSLALPTHTYLQLASRSGLAKKDIQVTAGIINPYFCGSIKALFINNSGKPFTFNKGQHAA